MEPLTVKNRRSKVSPGGVITLPVSARKTLKMAKGAGARVTVAIEDGAVALKPAGESGGFRVSAKGMLELRGEPRELLEQGAARHYWMELHDDKTLVLLHPYK
jgi:bifunctional DNA-binding transcriptional regulator/antitoxin component of YhaV-PrlF toxin-antitoxin module